MAAFRGDAARNSMTAAMCLRNGSPWPPWRSAITSAPSATKPRSSKDAGNRPGLFTATTLLASSSICPIRKENRAWMKAFKKRWKEKLEQLEIWMISYRIDIE